jgi:hypothetical protein
MALGLLEGGVDDRVGNDDLISHDYDADSGANRPAPLGRALPPAMARCDGRATRNGEHSNRWGPGCQAAVSGVKAVAGGPRARGVIVLPKAAGTVTCASGPEEGRKCSDGLLRGGGGRCAREVSR